MAVPKAKHVDMPPAAPAESRPAAAQPAPIVESDPQPQRSRRRALYALGTLCLALLVACWFESRSLGSLKNRHAAQTQSLQQMRADVERITLLSSAPRGANDHRRSSEELLAELEAALNEVGIPLDRWQDSVPRQPQQVPGSEYQQVATRLYFDELSLEGIIKFAHRLVDQDPSLFVSSVRINAGRGKNTQTWSVELTVTYLVYG
ncbi:MAG: hypothetical protein O7D91_15110 [Planctomycetota bacterium]|nr:hypothetical protein [Planctomycetota bacterium]